MWYSSNWNASYLDTFPVHIGMMMLQKDRAANAGCFGLNWFHVIFLSDAREPFVHFDNTQCRSSLDNFCLHSMPSTWSDTCFFTFDVLNQKHYQRIFNVPGEGVKIFSPPYLVRLHLISFLCFFIDFHLIILRQTAINQKGIHYEVKSFWSINQSFFPRWYESYHWC